MRRGFTLVELLIVSAIILVLIAFSTPLFRKTVADLELKETASNISKFIAFAQQEAIVNESVYKILFDFENKTYRLYTTQKVLVDGVEKEEISNLGGRFGRTFNLPDSITIEGETNEILFYPDGHCEPAGFKLELTSANKKTLEIATTGVLGNVIIEEAQK